MQYCLGFPKIPGNLGDGEKIPPNKIPGNAREIAPGAGGEAALRSKKPEKNLKNRQNILKIFGKIPKSQAIRRVEKKSQPIKSQVIPNQILY